MENLSLSAGLSSSCDGHAGMRQGAVQKTAEPVKLSYEADLCGNIEQALKGLQGYGIMALELIQNADDAGARTLSFDARSNALIVKNDAEFSSCGLSHARCPWERTGGPDGIRRPCNFHAIARMGSRSKIQAAEQIGRFGIGFVSVYQITDTPIVRSAQTEMLLNPLTGEALANLVDFTDGTEFELPWASEQSEIRDELTASPTPIDVSTRFVAEVSAVLRSSLLFLRSLERVEVRQSGIVQMTVHIERTETGIALEFGPDQRIERWLVLSRAADDIIAKLNLLEKYEALEKLDRSRTVSVAIAVNDEMDDGLLYAYLPTQHRTRMPFHINGDFFPHASRQAIVLKGEGHERYWNEALLATAAATISENFVLLRDTLGHSRLWQLGTCAFQLREDSTFSEFWTHFSTAAETTDSVWTSANNWHVPAGVYLAPEQMPSAEQLAVASIGLELLDQSLRRHWSALSSIGVGELRLPTVVTKLEALSGAGIQDTNPHLRTLWAAVARLIKVTRDRAGFNAVVQRLQATTFLIDDEGAPVCPQSVWRIPAGISPALVRRYAPECPIVHSDVLAHAEIAELIDEYTLDDFADNLASVIRNREDADQLIGGEFDSIRHFYELLTSFSIDPLTTNAGEILSEIPFLRTPHGFVSPRRGQLPGGFTDPTGHFEFVDTSLFPTGMEDFARQILGVSVLTFHEYIDDHLEKLLALKPTREQYQFLLTQIVERKNELDEQGSLELLAERAFVRTRAGIFVRPRDCYFWNATLEPLLGDTGVKWVEDSWLPQASLNASFRDLLESRLGTPTTVAVRHIVERLETIADGGIPDEVASAATPIFRHIIERWSRFNPNDLDELKELRNLEFLPAVIDGARDTENLYLPTEVYRAGRALGFASQVPIIDLPPLRQAGPTVNAVLELLDVPYEPETEVIVAHLLHCMATGLAPSDLTYAILNERVENSDSFEAIEDLQHTAFIYNSELKRFLRADQVFWQPPPFRDYWWAANDRMVQRASLYRSLGVRDCPGVANYAALLAQITSKQEITEIDVSIHAACMEHICNALDRGDLDVEPAIDNLSNNPSLLNLDGEVIYPDDALWVDSEQLVAPFGSALNYRLVQHPNVSRNAAARLFRRLGVRAISEVAKLCLASEPDRTPAEDATLTLRDRADLVLWLAPNSTSRGALRSILSQIQIQLTQSLKIRAEIDEFDPPVRSQVSRATALFEREAGVLHVEGSSMRTTGWTAAFRAIFSDIEPHCPSADVKPLVMTAAFIMRSESREEAEQALRSSDYRPPKDEAHELPLGEALGGAFEEEAKESADRRDAENNVHGETEDAEQEEAQHDRERPDTLIQDETKFDNSDRSSEDQQSDSAPVKAGVYHQRESNVRGVAEPRDAATGVYKSKPGTGDLGVEKINTAGGASAEQIQKGDAAAGTLEKIGPRATGDPSGERRSRTSRMLAYVAKAGHRDKDHPEHSAVGSDISQLIDIAAIEAALKYEERRGWKPEEQPHGNPGYDIISAGPGGARRLIEVKGLDGTWTQRGIKLSHVQYGMAEQHPDEYWIYVVENARDLDLQKVSAIGNPFQKVEEYWFDHNWRDTCDETANSRELNVHHGARVRHAIWGSGTVIEPVQRGIGLMVKVDFGLNGVKFIPFNSSLQIIS